MKQHPKPGPGKKILWANRYCLLDTSSGASISARQILRQLQRQGWQVLILGATVFDSERGAAWLKQQLPESTEKPYLNVTDPDGLEHRLVRTASWAAGSMTNDELNRLYALYSAALNEFCPDYVFFYGGNAFDLLIPHEARVRGIKTLAYLVNGNYLGDTRWCRDVDLILTDSRATAQYYKEKMHLEVEPIGTFIDPGKVIADSHERKHVLFINPVLEKGGAIVVQLAYLMSQRRPDIVFEVVESRGRWQPLVEATLKAMGLQPTVLPNVVVTPNQGDMRPVFARARLLLAPSLWWESGARVLAEAMLNGIPAIVTDRGGNEEMVEEGGIKIRFADELYQAPYTRLPPLELLDPIIERIIAFYDQPELYRTYCERALRVAQRVHNIENNTQRLLTLLHDLDRKGAAPKKTPHKQAPNPARVASEAAQMAWREICMRFQMFMPNSAGWTGGIKALAELTVQSAAGSMLALQRLASKAANTPSIKVQPLTALVLDEMQLEFANALAERFNHYGSDKASVHGYERLYAWLLAKRRREKGALLEIGLGTNNVDTPSNMGVTGKPGASVRAFRDLLPQFHIYGADVDRRILFEEERLRTFYVDQTNGKTLSDLQAQIGESLDLIIDDGLHAPHSNLNTLLFALEALKPGGYMVIEDITQAMLPIWGVAAPLLQAIGHHVTIYQCRAAVVVLVRKSLEDIKQ